MGNRERHHGLSPQVITQRETQARSGNIGHLHSTEQRSLIQQLCLMTPASRHRGLRCALVRVVDGDGISRARAESSQQAASAQHGRKCWYLLDVLLLR
jgi:hypothetical protein